MFKETPINVIWWGIGLTTLAVPFVAAAVGSSQVIIPLVVLGAGAVTARNFWPWRPLSRGFIMFLIEEPGGLPTTIAYLIGGIGGDIIVVFLAVVISTHLHTRPCFCGDARSLHFLWTLAQDASILSIGANFSLGTTVTALFRLAHHARSRR